MRFPGSRASSSRDFLDVTTPARRDNWQRLADHSDKALITRTPGRLDCICATDSYDDASRFYEFGNSGGIVPTRDSREAGPDPRGRRVRAAGRALRRWERLGARSYPSFGCRREVLPPTAGDQPLRSAVKRLIGFEDE